MGASRSIRPVRLLWTSAGCGAETTQKLREVWAIRVRLPLSRRPRDLRILIPQLFDETIGRSGESSGAVAASLRSGMRKIVGRQFEMRCRMGEQLALSNRADAAISVPEGL